MSDERSLILLILIRSDVNCYETDFWAQLALILLWQILPSFFSLCKTERFTTAGETFHSLFRLWVRCAALHSLVEWNRLKRWGCQMWDRTDWESKLALKLSKNLSPSVKLHSHLMKLVAWVRWLLSATVVTDGRWPNRLLHLTNLWIVSSSLTCRSCWFCCDVISADVTLLYCTSFVVYHHPNSI